ncbi:MAG TPA: signal peptidase II [Kiritimatiellia bacterium]|nr:signal peptidase II [Kiritimatiellia bacterium]HMO97681.1 signal peptidase II [Kiritimatiellia bacterium]HMP95542.1 signal peptidase II [Kiritimatiellia bacterium]
MLALWTAILVTLSDQWTKHWVRHDFYYGESRPVIEGFFNFTYIRNTGAAWGIMGGYTHVLTAISVIMLILMVIFRRSFLNNTWSHRLALGFMVGGIVGNLMDRLRQGWVTDFLDFYIGSWHWPCFNIADAAICVGVGIYLLTGFLDQRRLEAAARGAPPSDRVA